MSAASEDVCEQPAKRSCTEGKATVSEGANDDSASAEKDKNLCYFFMQGRCIYGSQCRRSHDMDPMDAQLVKAAGVRIIVLESAVASWLADLNDNALLSRGTGPLRLRIVGSVEELGCQETHWDPQDGMDLFWEERHRWTSTVLWLVPHTALTFYVVLVDQPERHPGVLQGRRRQQVHGSRIFYWGSEYHTVDLPAAGEILQVTLGEAQRLIEPKIRMSQLITPQADALFPNLGDLSFAQKTSQSLKMHSSGKQRCYTFNGPGGVILNFSLYLPASYTCSDCGSVPPANTAAHDTGWPLLIWLHSMHGNLGGDMNLFYESDAIPYLLMGDEHCPAVLSEKFIVLCPECPVKYGGIWLRRGWYDHSSYMPEIEVALSALFDAVASACNVNHRRISIVGSSMGGYAALELAKRRPGFFAALASVSGHYDLDPVDELVSRLTVPQVLPMWFFHSTNDLMCPYEPTEHLVGQLRAQSKAEVRFTSFEDTWSNQGHCADRVAFWSSPGSDGQPALGNELCAWFAAQQTHESPQP